MRGLDSSSCTQCVSLLQLLARQGRTIVCTIHQPSASLFQMFDHVYVLSQGRCLYQGATQQLVPYLDQLSLPCPMYHNPADYVIELACGEYGQEKIDKMVTGTDNGRCLTWFRPPGGADSKTSVEPMMRLDENPPSKSSKRGLQETSFLNQMKVLMRRGYIKTKRDQKWIGQPSDMGRFNMFFAISLLVVYVAMSFGLMIGALFDVVQLRGDDGAEYVAMGDLFEPAENAALMSKVILT
ncbi:hypothetical protein C0J52_17450 [Blattella germanica]|nr:hypothetical protein C0J52_17450 [Blattella germanica]